MAQHVYVTDFEDVVIPQCVVDYALTCTKNATEKSLKDRRTRANKFIREYAYRDTIGRLMLVHMIEHRYDFETAILFGRLPL